MITCWKWIGVDQSAVIAKSRVLLQMFQSKAHPNAILQVWYSAAWSELTTTKLKQAVELVLENPETEAEIKNLDRTHVPTFMFGKNKWINILWSYM